MGMPFLLDGLTMHGQKIINLICKEWGIEVSGHVIIIFPKYCEVSVANGLENYAIACRRKEFKLIFYSEFCIYFITLHIKAVTQTVKMM